LFSASFSLLKFQVSLSTNGRTENFKRKRATSSTSTKEAKKEENEKRKALTIRKIAELE
jgi:hypothetical protein